MRTPRSTHELGTGFYVNNSVLNAVKDFQSVTNRISTLTIQSHPTEENDEDTKEAFYSELERVYNNQPRNNIKIVLGDANAKIGRENTYRDAIGRESLHERTNNNGTRFINFAMENNLRISRTRFPHKRIHKGTWTAPDGRTVNQIDYIAIQKRFSNSIKDVRTLRGADCDSDHFLVRATMKIRLKRTRKTITTQRKYCLESLKDPEVHNNYQREIEQCIGMELSEEIQRDVDQNWKQCKETIQDVTSRTLNKRQKNDKVWFNLECQQKVKERIDARARWLNNTSDETLKTIYYEKRRETQIFLRQKKRGTRHPISCRSWKKED
ncbi:craniofacial development protein 2-like [Diaphorina citri]|uniref:Craniofacial development protein 2-like n=1 Tax=Diaphorina citri TaxID=121845 RepID=A0A1S3DGE8_DIACI|nr:craniofacial development protein 2-like [Diaphorina citri]